MKTVRVLVSQLLIVCFVVMFAQFTGAPSTASAQSNLTSLEGCFKFSTTEIYDNASVFLYQYQFVQGRTVTQNTVLIAKGKTDLAGCIKFINLPKNSYYYLRAYENPSLIQQCAFIQDGSSAWVYLGLQSSYVLTDAVQVQRTRTC